jgi:curved DNA-binding protein CbpA
MQGAPTHYEILGVPRDATAADLTAARNRLARRFHPDRHPDDVRRATLQLQAVNAAYEVLSDAQRRHAYDRALARDGSADFEFSCGDVRITSTGGRLHYADRNGAGHIARASITGVFLRPHVLAHGSATLVIRTSGGRLRFRLPRDAAEALVGVISPN